MKELFNSLIMSVHKTSLNAFCSTYKKSFLNNCLKITISVSSLSLQDFGSLGLETGTLVTLISAINVSLFCVIVVELLIIASLGTVGSNQGYFQSEMSAE
jgi:hypothetical protein